MSYWIKYRPMEQNRICKSYIWEGTLDTGGERKNSLMHLSTVRFSSFTQSCPTLCDPMGCSTPGFPAHHQLLELAQTHVHQVGDAIQPSCPCHLLLLLPSIFPSIRVFFNESVLPIRWQKYWSFSFSTSPSNEYSGLIFFRIIINIIN